MIEKTFNLKFHKLKNVNFLIFFFIYLLTLKNVRHVGHTIQNRTVSRQIYASDSNMLKKPAEI
jgi:hypothetical protein